MNSNQLNEGYSLAQLERMAAPENCYDIQQLLSKAPFFGWVDCKVNDCDFVMYLAGADDGVALRYFWNGAYESHSISLWAKLALQNSMINLDIGAHTGAYTLAALAGGALNVISVEPHFANYTRLLMNLRANGFPIDHALMMAVDSSSGWKTFSLPTQIHYLSTGGRITEEGPGLKFPVQGVTIDQLIGSENYKSVYSIKLDVEGHELAALTGAVQVISGSRPYIFFECISDSAGIAVQNFLKQYDYVFYLLDDELLQTSKIAGVSAIKTWTGAIDKYRLNRLAVPAGKGRDTFIP